ncbi:nicotinamide riboside transporter PnuC [Sphingomonas sp.]|uniref:nicotinamide riboside transporter PnuC n=1 Tax=Sphingomonas sp. TaxID=28214 RepID=UPI002DF05274|nr:nicotinamide riboside transporter PnuC [Sphingomonas sp.]HEV2567219.1 nicotinamide riboside transporter PnuC [Sphingomonas sp.]
MNPWEVLAASLGVINIVLIVRRSVWNYPFGIAMVSISAWLFVQPDVRLYSDALLQLFFFVVQLYGWWSWSKAQATQGEIAVERLPRSAWAACLAAITVTTLGWGALMYRFTDASLPWWDAFIAMASVAAQLLMARRYLENWLLWIVVDVVAIGVYAAKGLTLLALLYLLFLILSAVGFVSWRRAQSDRTATT